MGALKKLTAVISTKGQLIVPKAIRDQLHWEPGTRLIVEHTADGVLLKSPPVFAPTSVEALFGLLQYSGPALSVDDMDAAIAREAERRARD